MKVIDVLLETAEIMDLRDVKEILKYATEDNETETKSNSEVESLFNLLKLSIRELCTNYLPALKVENVNIESGEFKLSDLVNYIKIRTIKKNNEIVNFKVVNRNVLVDEIGEYEIEYYTYPEVNSLYDNIDFLEKLNSDVIIFGLSAYYCLSKGMFEDFQEMHDKYIERAECLKDLKTFTMPQRSWE